MGVPDFDFGRLVVGCIVVGAIAGVATAFGLPWVWALVKPLLHSVTA